MKCNPPGLLALNAVCQYSLCDVAQAQSDGDDPNEARKPLYIEITAQQRLEASPLVLNLINRLILKVHALFQVSLSRLRTG